MPVAMLTRRRRRWLADGDLQGDREVGSLHIPQPELDRTNDGSGGMLADASDFDPALSTVPVKLKVGPAEERQGVARPQHCPICAGVD